MNFGKIKQLVEDGYIDKNKHPVFPIYSYCYSMKTEIDEKWNKETLNCRGTIIDENGEIVFRAVKKFFNKGQNKIADESLKNMNIGKIVYLDKLDGSFIKVFNYNDNLVIGSKTSFENEFTDWAKEIIERDNLKFEDGLSYHFELIVPENRIVVDYKKDRNLYLWAVVETKTGKELDIFDNRFSSFNRVKIIEDVDKYLKKSNIEGVIIYDGKERLKLKTEEYLKLHKIRTMCSKKRIIELLKERKSIKDFNFPDEFIKDLIETENKIKEEFDSILSWSKKWKENIFDIKKMTKKSLALNTSLGFDKFQKNLLFLSESGNKEKVEERIWKFIENKEKEERIKDN
jgi:putative RNA ligase